MWLLAMVYVIYIPWLRGVYSPYTPRHGTYNIFSNLQKRQTCQIHNSCHVQSLKAFNAHCVHLSVFLGITLRFISSTLGDVVNVNREADMVSTFFFLDNESLFLCWFHFSAVTAYGRWQMADGNAHARYDAIVTWR